MPIIGHHGKPEVGMAENLYIYCKVRNEAMLLAWNDKGWKCDPYALTWFFDFDPKIYACMSSVDLEPQLLATVPKGAYELIDISPRG